MGILRNAWRRGRKKLTAWRARRLPPGQRLHVGCGPVHLDGWINIDNRPYPAVDYVLDVRDGVPFRELSFIYAEHFLEHLPYWEAERFLRDCRTALSPAGVLRLSTPNLDWVYETLYRPGDGERNPLHDCFELNKAFRAWGHHFLYNADTLRALLLAAGFATVRFCAYGESSHPELTDLERHPRSPDVPQLPHVLIVEATGVAAGGAVTASADYLQAMGAS